jgi:hypothetical protein
MIGTDAPVREGRRGSSLSVGVRPETQVPAMTRIALALFIVAHGLIHASYFSPRPAPESGGPAWPFELARSWLLSPLGVPESVLRPLGVILAVVAVVAFAMAGLATLGFILSIGAWQPFVVVGAVASLSLLILFFHPWLVLGLAIDAVLMIAIWQANWSPEGLT